MPAARAPSSIMPLRRVSRPRTMRGLGVPRSAMNRMKARPSLNAISGVIPPLLATSRTPSVPNNTLLLFIKDDLTIFSDSQPR